MATRANVIAGVIGALFAFVSPARADINYSIVHAFHPVPGFSQARLLQASDGALYGMTSVGGTGGGSIYRLQLNPLGGITLTVIHDFGGADGGGPVAGLIEGADGALYGTTPNHGGGFGTVFRVTKSGAFTLLHAFTGSDGANPITALVEAGDGNFYGTTREGGTANLGTVFRITPAGALTTLWSFTGGEGGAHPMAAMVRGTDGALYGVTPEEGPPGFVGLPSTIFRATTDGAFQTVHSFDEVGSLTGGLVRAADGTLFGIFSAGEAAVGDPSAVSARFFKLAPAGEVVTVSTLGLVSRIVHLTNAADGNFYGLADGIAFRVTPAGSMSTLPDFNGTPGTPYPDLAQAANGLFYGSTQDGGIANHGAIFSMTTSGAVSTRYQFTSLEGVEPWSTPIVGADGAFYGTTVKGGLFDRGTIYRLTRDGTVATLHHFSGSDGASPYAAPVQGWDGFLYGTTAEGCATGGGSIYRVAPNGLFFSVVHCFQPNEGQFPFASLMLSRDGNLYGTAAIGGPFGNGTIFRMSLGGAFAILQTFNPSTSASGHSFGPLVEAADGTFWGTSAGPNLFSFFHSSGTIFSLSHDGATLTTTFTFPSNGGVGLFSPWMIDGLTLAPDGVLYGSSKEEIVRFAPGSSVELIHGFSSLVSAEPIAPPIVGADGRLYGTTTSAVTSVLPGTIFTMTTTGDDFRVLKELTDADGTLPAGRLLQTLDGTFYGASAFGGPAAAGVIYRFTVQ